MDHLRTEIADLLDRHGRIPPADAERLTARAVNLGRDESWFQAEVKRVTASDPQLAAKRRLVRRLAIRAQLGGREFDADAEAESVLDEARAAGWSEDQLRSVVRSLAEEAIPAPPPTSPDRPMPPVRSRGLWLGATSIAVVAVVVAVLLLFARPFESDSAPPVPAESEIQPVLDGLEFAAEFDGAVEDEVVRLLERADRESADAITGPMTSLLLRRALRDAEPAVWESVAGAPSVRLLERFISIYPDGPYAVQASALLDELREARDQSVLIRRAQEEMVRLGRDVEATGELDAPTAEQLAALAAALGERGAIDITRDLVERLESLAAWPRRAGEVFRDCDRCPDMVVIPGGRFLMGSAEGVPGSEPNERPVHAVAVPRFALAQTEVTFEQWASCVEDGGCRFVPPDAGWGRGSRPVVNVSWSDALNYLSWLSDRTGHAYRLPTEAEWEYAARAGTTTRFHTGPCITSEAANFDGRLPGADCPPSEARRQTLPVGSFPPNAFGLFDMAGNVRELTRDCWNDNYEGAPSDGSAWMSGDCSRPVIRGGSWRGSERAVRSANRTRPTGAFNDAETGFRPARDLAAVAGD